MNTDVFLNLNLSMERFRYSNLDYRAQAEHGYIYINLHRWPISKTTGINIETQELKLKYYKLPDQLSKLHVNPPGGRGYAAN